MAKNALQEYCQKHKQPLPVYDTIPYPKNAGVQWVSTVTLADGNKFVGDSDIRKTLAEIKAAQRALDEIEQTANIANNAKITEVNKLAEKYFRKIHSRKRIILVDLDNMQGIVDKTIDSDDEVYGFLSTRTAIDREKLSQLDIKLVEIDSAVNDAVDHLLTWYASKLAIEYEKIDPELLPQIIVASRDKFADITRQLLGGVFRDVSIVTDINLLF